MASKGAGCSVAGGKYERQIAAVCRVLLSPHTLVSLCTQKDEELGGCGADIDIKLNWLVSGDVGLEAKKWSPDWMQCSIHKSGGSWIGSEKAKIPGGCKRIFESLINGCDLYKGSVPLLKHADEAAWKKYKKDNPELTRDQYFNCDSDTISRLYREKGCHYIQVGNGFGLYHTGDDVCGFGVPYFECKQRIRIRIKIHEKGKSLSFTAAAQPISKKGLTASPYSLDSADKLPLVLR